MSRAEGPVAIHRFERPTAFSCSNCLLLAKQSIAEGLSDFQTFFGITEDFKQLVFQGCLNRRFDHLPEFSFGHLGHGMSHIFSPVISTIVPRLSSH
jgi:hypothetical protein